MRISVPISTIALVVITAALMLGLSTWAFAQDDPAPEPAPADDRDQLIELPEATDGLEGYLHLPPPQMTGAVRDVSASDRQACVLLQSGLTYCWPLSGDGPDFVEPPNELFAAVAVGLDHACGLDAASRPICWGDDSRGQLDAPSQIFVDLAAGDHHTCGVDVANRVHCWGQLDTAYRPVPDDLYEQVAAGGDRTCVSGSWEPSRCFGSPPLPERPFDEVVRQIETSSDIVCALDLSNRPICSFDPPLREFEPPSPIASDLAVGAGFVCTLEPSGAIRCDGPNAPELPASPPISVAIDAGENTLCAMTTWGELQCWESGGSLFQ